MLCAFFGRHGRALWNGIVKIVILKAWGDVDVVVPDVLITGRFIMLAGGDAVTGVDSFHGQRQTFGGALNLLGVTDGEIKNVFVMLVGDDDRVTRIIRPLVRTDEGGYSVIVMDNITLIGIGMVIFYALQQQTERADVVFGGVIMQGETFSFIVVEVFLFYTTRWGLVWKAV